MDDDILRFKAFNGLYRQNLYIFAIWQDALFYGTYSNLAIYLKRHLFRIWQGAFIAFCSLVSR